MSTTRIPGNSCPAAPKFVKGLAYVIQGVQESCLREPTLAFPSKAQAQAALADVERLLNGPLKPAIVVFVQKINCEDHITFPGPKKLGARKVDVEEGTIIFPGTAGVPNEIEYTFIPRGTNEPIPMKVRQTKKPVDKEHDDIRMIEQLQPYVRARADSVAMKIADLWYTKVQAEGAKKKMQVCVPGKGNTCASAVWLTGQSQYFPHSSAIMDESDYNLIKNGGESLLDVFKKLGISEVVLAGLAPSKDLLHTAADLAMQGFKVSVLQSATSCKLPVVSYKRAFGHTLEAHDYAINSKSPYYRAQFADSLRIRVFPTWNSFTSEYAEQVAFKTPPGGKVRNNSQTSDLEFELYNVSLPIGRSTWAKLRGNAQEAQQAYADNIPKPVEGKKEGTELEQLLQRANTDKSTRFVSDKYVVIRNEGSPPHVEILGADKFLSRSVRWASVQLDEEFSECEFVSAIFCVRPQAFGFIMDSDESTMQLIKEMLDFRDSVAITMLLALLEQIKGMIHPGEPTTAPTPTQEESTPTKSDKWPDPTKSQQNLYRTNGKVIVYPTNPNGEASTEPGKANPRAQRAIKSNAQTPGKNTTKHSDSVQMYLSQLYVALFLVYQEALFLYQEADEKGQPKSQGKCLAELGFGWGSYTKPVGKDARKDTDVYSKVSNFCAYQRWYWQDNGRNKLGELYDKFPPERLAKMGYDIKNEFEKVAGDRFEVLLEAFDYWTKYKTVASLGDGDLYFTATYDKEYICLDDVFAYLRAKKEHEQKHPQCVSRSPSRGIQQEFIAYAKSKVQPYAPEGAKLSYVTVYPAPRSAEELQPGLFHVMAKEVPVDPTTQSELSSEPAHIALMLMPSNSYYDTQDYAKLLPFQVHAVAPFAYMQGGQFVPLHTPGNPCVLVARQA